MSVVARLMLSDYLSNAETNSADGVAASSVQVRNSDPVAILIATYNGGAYLHRQLETIRQQLHALPKLYVSDDGSQDGTKDILDDFARDHPQTEVQEGPRAGFAENFRSLMTRDDIGETYVAFSDQDDIWHHEKLATAIAWLKEQGDRPALYCSRTEYVSESEHHQGYSPRFIKAPSFRNALVQSIAGANTMVMNRPAFEIIRRASRGTTFVSHDWWCYQLVTGAGGLVRYAQDAHIRYRQHGSNQVGSNRGFLALLRRLKFLLDGGFSVWSDRNIASLVSSADELTPPARQSLLDFSRAREERRLLWRLYYLQRSGVYRQTWLGTASMYLACVIRKL